LILLLLKTPPESWTEKEIEKFERELEEIKQI